MSLPFVLRFLRRSLALFFLAPSLPALAQRAPYASPDALAREGPHHVLDVSIAGAYARVVDPDRVSGLANMGVFSLRTRLALGKTPAYCAGLDAAIGGSNRGVVYAATLYPIGVGGVWGDGNVVALCGGAGIDEAAGAVPVAARFPAESFLAVSLGPIRPVLWVRPSWTAGASARRHGSSISFIDEIEAGLLVRLSPQHRYWEQANAGGGLAVGVAYHELMDTRFIAAVIGFNLVGAR